MQVRQQLHMILEITTQCSFLSTQRCDAFRGWVTIVVFLRNYYILT